MIILDTNIVSEIARVRPDTRVLNWLNDRPESDVFLTSITVAELLYGVALLAEGRRRTAVQSAVQSALAEFQDRILDFDAKAAELYADVVTARRRIGRPIATLDAQIAAIARARGATLATRNVRDFEGCGAGLVNPFEAD